MRWNGLREYKLFLYDIKEAIEKIEAFTENISFEEFRYDAKTIDAVLRNMEIIGEASKNIPKGIRDKHNNIDWKAIIGMRDTIAHKYFGISLQIIWKTIEERLPELKETIEKIILNNQ
jgi:uncharacterized protein with HEPN domain